MATGNYLSGVSVDQGLVKLSIVLCIVEGMSTAGQSGVDNVVLDLDNVHFDVVAPLPHSSACANLCTCTSINQGQFCAS